MHTIDYSLINIPENRIRRHFDEDKLAELANSIASKGLMHPIVLRITDGKHYLVAGERRLRAMRSLHEQEKLFAVVTGEDEMQRVNPDQIPFNVLSELDEAGYREAELEENIVRMDISWQEQAEAVTELHKLRHAADPTWTMRDTTEEITGSPKDRYAEMTTMKLLGENLNNELVAKAESPKVAMKLLKQQAAKQLETSFAEYLSATATPEDTLVIEHGDGIQKMNALRDIHCVVADPPYGVEAQDFNNYDSILHHEYNDSAEAYSNLMLDFLIALRTCAAERAHLYLFFDIRWWGWLRDAFKVNAPEFAVWPWPIVWVKSGHGLAPDSECSPSRQYETILYANKGRRPTTALYPDVIHCKPEQQKIHAAQKPVDLYVNLLKRSCSAVDTMVDPFAGSGTAILAARQLGMTCYAYEIDKILYQRAQVRIATEVDT